MTQSPRDGRSRARRVTLADVARKAGVDKAVVSRVVNADPLLNIRPETRARVNAALKELDYRPNVAARSLRTAKAGTVGLFIPDFANPVYAEIITGAETAAADLGCALMVGSSTAGRGARSYLDLLGQGRVDGLLLAGGTITGEEQATLADRGLPWLFVNRRGPGSGRHVILDDVLGARVAVDHLLDLGHRRIAHVGGPPGADTAHRRHDGYATALRSAGLEEDPRLVVQDVYGPDGGVQAVRLLLDGPEPPTAMFVANVASAIGVLSALRARGVSVPEEMSVVAVHDLPLAEHLIPPLTTVRMPLRALGARATKLLLSVPADHPVEEVVREPIELVVRQSTAGPRR
ncbi:LacI family DNA-binding transcriptional regulator [Actinomadura algeriensis]|uniref:LacI family transcriptional regulator n=1 Tax=Actinomadura algeriensis TaxID=1679523 RepID=A0ABR9JN99_9ACTN|nr:LacI family DNA-binding transcriptional regulator [Actinomadura algeriensis]MBE1532025.1 LacI family transcriptional regulator [Actinomadura algeriensis]